MILVKNYFLLFNFFLKNKLGKGHYFKKKIFETQRILESNFPKQ